MTSGSTTDATPEPTGVGTGGIGAEGGWTGTEIGAETGGTGAGTGGTCPVAGGTGAEG